MSTDRLREAAALLRTRADAATAATGEWCVSYIPEQAVPNAHIIDRWFVMDRFESGQETGPYATCEYEPAAHFIAMMSPPVARALADLLDEHDETHSSYDCYADEPCAATSVADAILGAIE
jgi:hypothetical protein